MNIKDYWIKELQEVKEFKAIADTENVELASLHSEIENLIDDQFIETATVKGIARREKMLKIQPFADDTLQTRRARVGLKWGAQLPYTYRQLELLLTNLLGPTGFLIELNRANHTLHVKLELTNKRLFDSTAELVNAISPATLLITVSLLYNQYNTLSAFTYDYLKAYTYEQLRSEVIS